MGSQTDDVEHHGEKIAHLLHELVDRVAHSTENDRLALHDLVSEVTGGITKNQAADAVADPAAYAEARDNGAYDAPAAPVVPLTPDQQKIAALEAELAVIRGGSGTPPTPPEQAPATSRPPTAAVFSDAASPPEPAAGDSAHDTTPTVTGADGNPDTAAG